MTLARPLTRLLAAAGLAALVAGVPGQAWAQSDRDDRYRDDRDRDERRRDDRERDGDDRYRDSDRDRDDRYRDDRDRDDRYRDERDRDDRRRDDRYRGDDRDGSQTAALADKSVDAADDVAAPLIIERAPAVEFELHTMSEGSYTAFVTEVEGADDKLALSEWRDLMREYGVKPKRSKPERVKAEEVVIASIGGSDPLGVYADFEERGSRVKAIVWIKQRDVFLDDASAQRDIDNATALMEEYALRLRRAAINEELTQERRDLERVQKKFRKLEQDLDRYERTIERAKEQIATAEQNIIDNAAAQRETQVEIAKAEEAVKAVQRKLDSVKG